MKLILVLLPVFFMAANVKSGDLTLLDRLVDDWLRHASEMFTTSDRMGNVIKGIDFNITNQILLGNVTLSVKADIGIISGVDIFKREDPLSVTFDTPDFFYATFNLSLNPLIRYPTLYISGPGVKIIYEDVLVNMNATVGTVYLTLNFASGNNDTCNNDFNFIINDPNISVTVTNPPLNLPLDDPVVPHLIQSLEDAIKDRMSSIITNKSLCSKLLNII